MLINQLRRTFVKLITEAEIEGSIRELNFIEFLSLEGLESDDVEVFQKAQQHFYLIGISSASEVSLDHYEPKMRALIKDILQYHFLDKWYIKSVIPCKQVIEEKIYQEKISKPQFTEDSNKLTYSLLSDLTTIVCKRDNWRECFKPIFNNTDSIKDDVLQRMTNITDLRNKIKHYRMDFTREDVQRTLQDMVWVLKFFNSYQSKLDFFSRNKKIEILKIDNENQRIRIGRLHGKVSKTDAEKFGSAIKSREGHNPFNRHGSFFIDFSTIAAELNLPLKKILLLLTFFRENIIINISRKDHNRYRIDVLKSVNLI